MGLPLLHLTGPAYAQGAQQGEQLRARVLHNIALYFDRFEREVKLDRAEVFAVVDRYLPLIEARNRSYFDGMRGLADGAGVHLNEIAALTLRYEILYYRFGELAMVDGCTAFAVLPEASKNGHLLHGQNWDWIPDAQGALLHTIEPDGLETLGFTEAGIFGAKIGMNSTGVGLTVNGLSTTDDDWFRPRLPFHVRCFEILRSDRFDAALNVITGEERVCSTNFMVTQSPNFVANIEAAPTVYRTLAPEGGVLVHTNHFLDPGGMGLVEPPNERRPHSYFRYSRLSELFLADRPLSIGRIQQMLRDHEDYPFGLCRHEDLEVGPEEHYVTVTSVIMDMHALEMRVTDGRPCSAEYETHRLDARPQISE